MSISQTLFTVNGHLQPLRARDVLIGALAVAVQPSSLVPSKVFGIAHVECAVKPSVHCAADDVLPEELRSVP